MFASNTLIPGKVHHEAESEDSATISQPTMQSGLYIPYASAKLLTNEYHIWYAMDRLPIQP